MGRSRPTSTRPPRGAVDILLKLYRAYTEGDADLTEINPLILKPTGEVHALDAKVTLDGNAAYRHEVGRVRGRPRCATSASRPPTRRACSTSGLDGSVGIIANGAGLAMSTLDVVNQVGGSPANFLDIGGGANADVMAGALEVINNDPAVKSIFINIFGGITRGEEVANGILEALTGSRSRRRSSSASTAPTPMRAGRSSSRTCPTSCRRSPRCSTPPARSAARRRRKGDRR